MSFDRKDLALISEAHAVACSALVDNLEQPRLDQLVKRLDAAPSKFEALQGWVKLMALWYPQRRGRDGLIVKLSGKMRSACTELLRPEPVGLDRRDIHG